MFPHTYIAQNKASWATIATLPTRRGAVPNKGAVMTLKRNMTRRPSDLNCTKWAAERASIEVEPARTEHNKQHPMVQHDSVAQWGPHRAGHKAVHNPKSIPNTPLAKPDGSPWSAMSP